jgi:hypothetical protein
MKDTHTTREILDLSIEFQIRKSHKHIYLQLTSILISLT